MSYVKVIGLLAFLASLIAVYATLAENESLAKAAVFGTAMFIGVTLLGISKKEREND